MVTVCSGPNLVCTGFRNPPPKCTYHSNKSNRDEPSGLFAWFARRLPPESAQHEEHLLSLNLCHIRKEAYHDSISFRPYSFCYTYAYQDNQLTASANQTVTILYKMLYNLYNIVTSYQFVQSVQSVQLHLLILYKKF